MYILIISSFVLLSFLLRNLAIKLLVIILFLNFLLWKRNFVRATQLVKAKYTPSYLAVLQNFKIPIIIFLYFYSCLVYIVLREHSEHHCVVLIKNLEFSPFFSFVISAFLSFMSNFFSLLLGYIF